MNSSFLNVHTGNGRKRREMEADLRVGITDYDDGKFRKWKKGQFLSPPIITSWEGKKRFASQV